MSRPHETSVKAAAMQLFTMLLLSLGLSLTALKALLPLQALWPAAVFCLLFSLALEGLYLLPLRKKWLLPLTAAAAVGLWGALGGGPVHTAVQLGKAAFLALRGIPDAAAPYADAARLAVCLIFTLLSAALTWDDTLSLAFFSVATILGLIFVFSAQAGLLLYALPAAAGLLLMMAQGKENRVSPLFPAVLLALLAFFLVPARQEPVPQLAKVSSDIRQLIEDYLLFNEFRSSFSLTNEGFQPLEDRLGGPAEPESHQVMEVQTPRTLLMKGKSYNEYTGLNWYDTLSSRRYLYASPRFTSLREELFDLNRPLADGGAEPETVHVQFLGNGTTTLFAPSHTRTLQMESQRMVLYYNMAGELFITRDLQSGDSYTLTCLPAAASSRQTAALVAACAEREDPYFTEVRDIYLKLPPHIQQEIFDIAHEAAGNAETPYEKALNIMQYLRTHYRYRLDVRTPPEGIDFTAWFLIGEKEGYCTYFATAMTVLCRIEGIPARYVTGYIAAPDESGQALVTGREAHAWTEVYLNGYGWLPMDATPRSQDENPNNDPPERSGDTPPAPTPTPAPTAPPEGDSPSPTPQPEEGTQQEPSPQPDDPPTPTPQPEESGAATPTPPPGLPTGNEEDSPDFPWLILLLALLLILLLVFRFLWTEPLRRARRKPDRAAEILFSAMAGLLTKWGVTRRPQETLHEFAYRADQQLAGKNLPSLWPLAQDLAGQVYGRHPAPAAPFRSAYTALRNAAGPWTRCRLAVKRMFRLQQ